MHKKIKPISTSRLMITSTSHLKDGYACAICTLFQIIWKNGSFINREYLQYKEAWLNEAFGDRFSVQMSW